MSTTCVRRFVVNKWYKNRPTPDLGQKLIISNMMARPLTPLTPLTPSPQVYGQGLGLDLFIKYYE